MNKNLPVNGTPLQIHMHWWPLHRAINKCALERPTCVSKSLDTFGCIQSSGLGDSIMDMLMDKQTDRQDSVGYEYPWRFIWCFEGY